MILWSIYSLNWQHQLCKNPRPNPDIKTLFTDHTCAPSIGALAPTTVNLPTAVVAKPTTLTPLGAHGQFLPAAAAAANANALAGWMANVAASSFVQTAVVATLTLPILPNQVGLFLSSRDSSHSGPARKQYFGSQYGNAKLGTPNYKTQD